MNPSTNPAPASLLAAAVPSGGTGDAEFVVFGRSVAKKWVSLILLVFQTTFLVLIMRYSRVQTGAQGPYLVSTAVVLSEVLKVVVSFGMIWIQASSTREAVHGVMMELRGTDTLRLAVPGLLYLIQNNLLFVALSNLEAAVYQVIYQLKIMTTALFSITMLGKKLTTIQVASLVLLMFGVGLVQLAEATSSPSATRTTSADQDALLGLVCVLTASVSSGFAGVYLEKVMKRGGKPVSLWMRNIQLGLFGTVFGLVTILGNPKDRQAVANRGFFQGYNNIVAIVVIFQAIGGLLIAAVMQYADNILKGFATSVSIVLSSLISMWLFEFKLTGQFVIGAMLVILAVMMYSRPTQPPVKSNETKV